MGDSRLLVPPFPPEVNSSGDLALLTVIIPGEPSSQAAVDAVFTIRDQYVPAALEGVDAEILVGGLTAEATDVFSIVETYTPIVFAFVLGFSFIILMLVFRSIVIPIKAGGHEPPLRGHGVRAAGPGVPRKTWARTCWGSSTQR